jgi:hypothetical protein
VALDKGRRDETATTRRLRGALPGAGLANGIENDVFGL